MSRVFYTISLCLLILAVPALSLASGEQSLRTTDDTRRVPLPAHDGLADPILVIEGGTLIDGRGGEPVHDAVVVVQGDRIVAAGPAGAVQVPAHVDQRIAAHGLYLIPGLIDLHVHFTQQRGNDFARYRDSDAAAAIRGTMLLAQFLNAGITAVRDVGTSNDVALRIKEAVERGLVDGPRVLWSGQLIASRGGHGNEITATGTGSPRSLEDSARVRVANGPWDWRLAVREQIRLQADWIKLTAPYTLEEVTAAVEEAHLHHIPVTVDSFGEFTRWAAEAGIDSIEHPLNLNVDILEVMAKSGTALVPTITAFYNVLTEGYPSAGIAGGGFHYTMSRRFALDHEQHIDMVRQAHKLGIPIGVGTDIPFENEVRYPGAYYLELGFLKDAGLSNQDILASTTRVGAKILGLGDKLGTLEAGKLADLVILGSNPLEDIQNLQDIRHVLADGRLVR